jgi:hypothetical protein
MQYWVPKRNILNIRRFYYSVVNHENWKSPLRDFFNPIAKVIKKNTEKNDKILVLGEEPIINLLSERIDIEMPNIWTKSYKEFNDFGEVTVTINRPVQRVDERTITEKLTRRKYIFKNQIKHA